MRQSRAGRERVKGFSLVELMLALALGLVVVAGIVQLFVGNSQTYSVLNGQARMQESARFALDFISRASRSAGYMGCDVEKANLVWDLRGNATVMPEFRIEQMVEGYDGKGGGNWSPSLTALPKDGINAYDPDGAGNVGIDTGTIIDGTDVLAVRSVQRPGQRLVQTLQPSGDPVVSAPGGDPGFGVNDVVLVANCEQGAVFRITGMNVAGNQATLLHATSSTGNVYENADVINSPTGPVASTLSFLGRSYGPEASVGRVETTYFFVADGAGLDAQGNPVPALWEKVGRSAPVELIQGIEDLQVLYGIDTTLTDGVTNANQYVTFDNVPDPKQVVSLRVSVKATSVDPVAGTGEVLKRVFSKTILLRNAKPEAV